jgi:multidrug efflux pump subunit AcrA (membrane-fusion protein)
MTVAMAVGATGQENGGYAVFCKKAVSVEKSYHLDLYGTFVHEKSTVIYPPNVGIIQKVMTAKGEIVKKGQALLVITRDEPGFTRKKTTIKAPFSGLVKLVNAYEGGRFSPGTPLLTLAAFNPIYCYTDIRETDLGKVAVGDTVEVRLHYLEVPVEGIVVSILDVNPQKRMAQLKLKVANTGGKILAGSEGSIRYETGKREVVVIPAEAVLAENGSYFAWVKQGNVASKKKIRIGDLRDDGFEVVSGISAGEDVIYYGYLDLTEGSPVKVVEIQDEH